MTAKQLALSNQLICLYKFVASHFLITDDVVKVLYFYLFICWLFGWLCTVQKQGNSLFVNRDIVMDINIERIRGSVILILIKR